MPDDLEPFLDGNYNTEDYDGPVGVQKVLLENYYRCKCTQIAPVNSFARRTGIITAPKNGIQLILT